MTIENLTKVVPPPAAPLDVFPGPWSAIEAELGVALPADYKDFARLYGSGSFMEFVWIWVPRSSDHGAGFVRRVREACHGFRSMAMQHPIWPSPGGLLPLGWTDNNDHLFWLPQAEPESWRVLVWDRGAQEGLDIEAFDCDLTDFLAGLATGDITPTAFPDDFFPWDILFRPHAT